MYVTEFPCNKIVRLHSTAYYRIKNYLEVLRKEKTFQYVVIFKKLKKPLQIGPFSLTLPIYYSGFPAWQKNTPTKMFLLGVPN